MRMQVIFSIIMSTVNVKRTCTYMYACIYTYTYTYAYIYRYARVYAYVYFTHRRYHRRESVYYRAMSSLEYA